MKFLFLALLPSFLIAESAFAVSAQDVVKSALQHYPLVNQSLLEIEAVEANLQSSRGTFDAKIKAEMDSRTEGYYDGDAFKAGVEKPFPFLNSKIYGGKRQSFGSFPSYEGKSETLSEGEYYAGLSVSLLRDSLIDANRYQIRLQKQDLLQSQWRADLMRINVQTMALKAYWFWLIKGQELKVYQNLLGLAQTRVKQIAKRIKVGDLAAIYESENNQYIRKREAQVMYAQMEFQKASYYLSLFHRDSQGAPVSLSFENLPNLTPSDLKKVQDFEGLYNRALAANFELKILGAEKQQAELTKSLGTNEMLPRVDVNFEWNQDQGFGPSRLAQDENRIMLNLEIPIEYRKGSGKREAGKAKMAQVDSKLQFMKEKLKVETQSLQVNLNSYAEVNKISEDQYQLAAKLASAEVKKFSRGASDLILVNLREEAMAEAEVKYLTTRLQYQFIEADLKALLVDFLVKI